MITIYQIPTNFGLAPIEVLNAKMDLMLGFKKWKNEYSAMYVKTYEVDTDNLEEAFEYTNLWNENHLVTRHRQGGSTSVGDIAVKDGCCYFCDDFGWVAIGKYEGLN